MKFLECENRMRVSVRRACVLVVCRHAGDHEGNTLGHQDSGVPDHNATEDHNAQGSLPSR